MTDLAPAGFRALVEENVKVSVKKLASDGIVREVRRD
jgi:hypothetical protein